MQLNGIHHITAITDTAQRAVDFYVGVLGLRCVKQTVNQDVPSTYHLYFADHAGSPGSVLTFFEFPGVPKGVPGAGMVHTIAWRVGSEAALDFWQQRLAERALAVEHVAGELHFTDLDGLQHAFVVNQAGDQPLRAESSEIPSEYALLGFEGVRAYTPRSGLSEALYTGVLGFTKAEGAEIYTARGEKRGGYIAYSEHSEYGVEGVGSVHHVAWTSSVEDQDQWAEHIRSSGVHSTGVVERFYFRSIYFREPAGTLVEIATNGPGFTVDEALADLGSNITLPPKLEQYRERIVAGLAPLEVPS